MYRIIITLLATLFALSASADPGVGTWLDSSGNEMARLGTGDRAVYDFTTAVNSKVLAIQTASAQLCFETDTLLEAAGAARITAYMSLDFATHVKANAITQVVTFDGTNCLDLVIGQWWIEVDTARAASQTPRVWIQTRSN